MAVSSTLVVDNCGSTDDVIIVIMRTSKSHIMRVNAELESSGLTWLNLLRFTSKYLPEVIHKDEHILAAVSGRNSETAGFFGFAQGMLVATNLRVIYIDHRPGYTSMDEISYDVISGVNLTQTLVSSSVTMFSKVSNYVVSYARPVCARKFVDYVEQRALEHSSTR